MTPDPTVLRERAKRLEWLSNDRFYVAVEELRADAADLRLLADLLDAIGDPDNLRTLGAAFDLPYLPRIASVLNGRGDRD